VSIRLITGDDEVLVAEAVSKAVSELLASEDRSLALHQLTEDDYRTAEGQWNLAPLADAAMTPPFLSAKRVVVGRHMMRFAKAAELQRLVDGPLPDTTELVLVWERGQNPQMTTRAPTLPKALKAAVADSGGELLDVSAPRRPQELKTWVQEQLQASSLRFSRDAVRAVQDLVGSEQGLIVGLIRNLEGALGHGAQVTPADVAAYGGEAGAVVGWELDDAIDRGDIAGARKTLHRLLPTRNPHALLGGMHSRYQRMLRLDGAAVMGEREAAELLGMKGSAFPARKLLNQTDRLGSSGVARAIRLLADADLALKGKMDWPPELVMEVLVARLAALSVR